MLLIFADQYFVEVFQLLLHASDVIIPCSDIHVQLLQLFLYCAYLLHCSALATICFYSKFHVLYLVCFLLQQSIQSALLLPDHLHLPVHVLKLSDCII
jgi:hypothetical protein